MVRNRRRWALLAAAVFCCVGAVPPHKVIGRIDLSKPFHLPRGALFTALQGPDVKDPLPMGDLAPGAIRLCIQLKRQSSCAPNIRDPLAMDADRDLFSETHFLQTAEVIYPRGVANPALLHLQVGSFYSGDGD